MTSFPSSSIGQKARAWACRATRFRWVSMAALGRPVVPPGVGQDREIAGGINIQSRRRGGIFFQQIRQKGAAPLFDLFFGERRFSEGFGIFGKHLFENGKIFVYPCYDHLLGIEAGLVDVVEQDVLTDDHLGLAVFELMFDLDARIDRAYRRHPGAQPERREVGKDVLGAVQQMERHGISLSDAEIGQGGCRAVNQFLELAVGYLFSVKDQGRPVFVFFRDLVEQGGYGRLGNSDVCGNAFGVVCEPWSGEIKIFVVHKLSF